MMTGTIYHSWKPKIDTDQCKECQYWRSFNESSGYCDYLNIEGHRRPKANDGICPARLEISIRKINV